MSKFPALEKKDQINKCYNLKHIVNFAHYEFKMLLHAVFIITVLTQFRDVFKRQFLDKCLSYI